MLVGLPDDQSVSGASLTQVSTVAGLALSVPIANRSLATETSINLHACSSTRSPAQSRASPAHPSDSCSAQHFHFGNVLARTCERTGSSPRRRP